MVSKSSQQHGLPCDITRPTWTSHQLTLCYYFVFILQYAPIPRGVKLLRETGRTLTIKNKHKFTISTRYTLSCPTIQYIVYPIVSNTTLPCYRLVPWCLLFLLFDLLLYLIPLPLQIRGRYNVSGERLKTFYARFVIPRANHIMCWCSWVHSVITIWGSRWAISLA